MFLGEGIRVIRGKIHISRAVFRSGDIPHEKEQPTILFLCAKFPQKILRRLLTKSFICVIIGVVIQILFKIKQVKGEEDEK